MNEIRKMRNTAQKKVYAFELLPCHLPHYSFWVSVDNSLREIQKNPATFENYAQTLINAFGEVGCDIARWEASLEVEAAQERLAFALSSGIP